MILQGGVEQNEYQGGMPQGGESAGGGIGGATPWGAIIQQIGEHRKAARQGFGEMAQGMTNNALAASSYRPTFNPTMTPIQQAQFMPAQNNLYNRLMG